MVEYTVILISVLLFSPFILKIASSKNKKTKLNLRIIFLILLTFQILAGFLNWETFRGQGRSGFELASIYPTSYLWLFFAVAAFQAVMLLTKKQVLDTLAVVFNFLNTIIFFAAMARVSNLAGQQIVSWANVGVIFAILGGNIVGLALINKKANLSLDKP